MNGISGVSGKRVLVTGAAGFIGSHLCRRLLALGADVFGVDVAEPLRGLEDVRWRQSDMAEMSASHSAVRSIKPDIVFHLSSYVSGSRDPDVVYPTFRSNLMSTVNILTALDGAKCQRVVLVGSMEEPPPGQNDLTSISPYAVSKLASSTYGRMFYSLYGLPVVILHLFMVYGPGQRDTKKLVPYVTLSVLKDERPSLMSGIRRVDWIYIDDVVEGLVASAQADKALGQTIDLGSGTLTSVGDIVKKVMEIANSSIEPIFGALVDRPYESSRLADVSRTLELIGWRALVSLEDGLSRTVRWYKEELIKGRF